MKKVYQTKFLKEGNCLSACLASLLEINIELIPNYNQDDWLLVLNEWLIANYNLYLLPVSFEASDNISYFRDSYYIGCGHSKNELLHAVICKDRKIVHDPLPDSGVTYDKISTFDLLLKYFK